jgi:pyruvate ferredoxin oxidoreductase delta subunit
MTNWRELPPGVVITDPGSSRNFKTGSWRSFKPVWIRENCVHCMLCWVYCPDTSVVTADNGRGEFDYDFCKGCGICALECPGKQGNKAIVMEEEGAR